MGVGYCNASGAPRSKTKITERLPPDPQEQPCMPWSNLSAIIKKKVSTEFRESRLDMQTGFLLYSHICSLQNLTENTIK